MSVAEGAGTLNGTRLKKGDHLILPDGYGKVELQGRCRSLHLPSRNFFNKRGIDFSTPQ
ncbi:MAG: hypothetical protein ACLTAX_18465 [Waltera sp.]